MLLTNLLATSQVEFRHFAIQTRLAAKKKIQNLLSGNKAVPDLGKYESIEQYMQGKWFSMDMVTFQAVICSVFFLENSDRYPRSDFCNVIYVKNLGC